MPQDEGLLVTWRMIRDRAHLDDFVWQKEENILTLIMGR